MLLHMTEVQACRRFGNEGMVMNQEQRVTVTGCYVSSGGVAILGEQQQRTAADNAAVLCESLLFRMHTALLSSWTK